MSMGRVSRRGLCWSRLRRLLGSAAVAWLVAAPAGAWERYASGEGVTVYITDVPGQSVPRFKGVATIDADPLLLLAVLDDVGRSCEWNAACVHSNVLRTRGDFDHLVHIRLKATWPVSDRDAVLQTDARVLDQATRVTASFRGVAYPGRKPADGVVRFAMLHGRYDIRAIAPGRSSVEYVIDSDPSGMIPSWFVKYAVKNVPISTLAGLRKQAKRRAADYAAFVARHRALAVPAPPPAAPAPPPKAPPAAAP